MPTLTFSGAKVHDHNFEPYIDIDFKTSLCLDAEVFVALKIAGESVLNVLVAEYRQVLENKLAAELAKYGIQDTPPSAHLTTSASDTAAR